MTPFDFSHWREEEHHSHFYQIIATDLVCFRYCTLCGKAWKLRRTIHQWQDGYTWQAIEEPIAGDKEEER